MNQFTPETTRRRGAHKAPRHRVAPLAWLTAVLVFFGACIMLYPSAASWYGAVLQAGESDNYSETVRELGAEGRAAALTAARDYNSSLADGSRIVDPFAAIQDTTVKDSDQYWSLLDPAGDGVMGALRIPSIQVNIPIYHGTGNDVLLRGVGHLQGTALPLGGTGTHSVLTGHRGLPQAALFNRLDELAPGDMIELDTLGQVALYKVMDSSVVLPSETETLRPLPGRDQLTLVTCTPLGINSHRILVTAERVPSANDEIGTPVDAVGFPWWALAMAGVLALDCLYLMRSCHRTPSPNIKS